MKIYDPHFGNEFDVDEYEEGDILMFKGDDNKNLMRWIVTIICLGIFCYCVGKTVVRGEQVSFPPRNNKVISSSKLLTDLVQHCDQPFPDTDATTYAHETTHSCNARVHDFCRLNGAGAGIYCYNNVAFCVRENGTKMSDLARAIPYEYRSGGAYKTYVIDSVQSNHDYANRPCYIIDEWDAYINGCLCGVECRTSNDKIDFSFDHACQLGIFTIILNKIMKSPDLQKVIDYQIPRMNDLHLHFTVSSNTEAWYKVLLTHYGQEPKAEQKGLVIPLQ